MFCEHHQALDPLSAQGFSNCSMCHILLDTWNMETVEKRLSSYKLEKNQQYNSFKDGIEISYKSLNQGRTCKNISDEINGFFFLVFDI